MVTVDVDDNSLQVDSQPKSVGLVWGLVLSLDSLNELSELWQWPCHDDSSVNIVFGIINFLTLGTYNPEGV